LLIADPASLTQVIVLDLLLYIMQLTSLIVSYINNHAKDLPSSSVFLYEDLLLPPRDLSSASSTALDEDDLDLEGGEGKQRRRKGKGTAYEPLEGDANKLWLNDDDDEPDSSATRICKPGTSVPIDAAHGPLLASSRRPLLSPSVRSYRRHHEPPLIFSLPLSHIIQLIFQLPSPTPPPPVLAGGTPVPVATPVTEEPPPLSSIQEGDEEAESSEEEEEEVVDGVGGGSPSSRRRGRMRGAAGIMPDVGRIPGEYRTGSGRGNGG